MPTVFFKKLLSSVILDFQALFSFIAVLLFHALGLLAKGNHVLYIYTI